MKLAECSMHVEGEKRYFEFEGEVTVDSCKQDIPNFDFQRLIIFERKGTARIPFEPKGYSWNGRKIDCNDAITDVIGRYSRSETDGFELLYLCKELKQVVDTLRQDIAVNVKERHIPKRIVYGCLLQVYELYFATDSFTYYAHDDCFLMVETVDGSAISDNYFAEVGIWESVKAINEKKETLLYGCVDELMEEL